MLYEVNVHVQPDGFTTCSRFPTPAVGHTHPHALFRTSIGLFLHPGIPPRLCMPPLVRTTCSLFASRLHALPVTRTPQAPCPHPRPFRTHKRAYVPRLYELEVSV